MPDNNQTNTPLPNDVQAPQVPTDTPAAPKTAQKTDEKSAKTNSAEVMAKVGEKIAAAHNILVALSSDPSVDELATAIGLSLCLDKLGKRATAIYSGATPNALEFLKPEEAFDTTADTLQDFVIALNKEKADHLRYKLDGDYVKIFITPYRSRIAEDDLEFSYGDFNIDLVLALDVANGVDLDSALREHGRIMHDASVVNITTGNPGKFGEIEWSDKTASSVAEMVSRLLYNMGGKSKIAPEEATALLTGIVAATERFSKGNTTAETMRVASKLMESGANQQLIAKNITSDINNQLFAFSMPDQPKDDSSIDIKHKGEPGADEEPSETAETVEPEEDTLLNELKATEASLANAGAETTPEAKNEPVRLDETPDLPSTPAVPSLNLEPAPAAASEPQELKTVEKVIAPPDNFAAEISGEGTNRYGQMLEDALAEHNAPAPTAIVSEALPEVNPAAAAVPTVASAPEINGVPDINYMPPLPGDQVLPPPPTPPIPENPTPLGAQPAMQDQIYHPQASTPDAFKIPGM